MDKRDINMEEMANELEKQISTMENIQTNMLECPFYPQILGGNFTKIDWFKDFQSECNTLLKSYFGKDSDEYKEFNEKLSSMVNDIKGVNFDHITEKEERKSYMTEYIFKRFENWLKETIRDLKSFSKTIKLSNKEQKEIVPFQNNNYFEIKAEAKSTSSSSSIMNINIEQTINAIKEMPEATLSQEEKEKLQNDLYTLEDIKTTKDKKKFWEKAKPILSFLTDKGADALIAVAPYIITLLKTM